MKAQKRILVVQLCRIGDILMTGPLLRGLRREHPAAEISLMVMDTFAATPLPSHLYDRLIAFPLGGLATTLARRDVDWQTALDQLRAFVRDCASEPFDQIINLTHTDMSALIVSLLPAKTRSGLVMRSDRRRAIDSPWMNYMRAAVRSRDLACFHLVDLFSWTGGIARDSGGLEIDVTPADHEWAERFIASCGAAGRPLIAMQLGASTEAKQWPLQRFAELADALDAALGEIVIVGGPSERALATEFMGMVKRPVISTAGESTLRQLAALLQRCRLLITNDTGPMHVATAVGTRVMDISSGPVCAYETGPYGEGHIVIEPEIACFPCPLDSDCSHFACRETFSAADAAAVARFAMDEGPAPSITGARIMRSRRIAASGRIEFTAVGVPSLKDRVRLDAASVWELSLAAPRRVGDGWSTEPAPRVLPMVDAARLAEIRAHLQEVGREAESAATAVRALPKASPAKVASLAESVHATLERLLALGETERAAHAIVTHLRHEIDSVHAQDLPAMARAQATAYTATAARARQLADTLAS